MVQALALRARCCFQALGTHHADMNLTAALFAPFALFLTAISGGGESDVVAPSDAVEAYPEMPVLGDGPVWAAGGIPSFLPHRAEQVHIEQRTIIRVAPRGARTPMPPAQAFTRAHRPKQPHFTERKVGKCLPIAGIAGVEPNGTNSLILFMRDRRMISVELDRSCHSRTFYSGFYLSRSDDGMVCVDRDSLHSRSGSTCKLSRMRQLIVEDD